MEIPRRLKTAVWVHSAFRHRAAGMNNLAEEFRDLRDLYIKLTADFSRIAAVGKSGEDQQPFIQSIIDNQNCLTEIQQLNNRFTKLYGVWKDKDKNNGNFTDEDEIRGFVDDIENQMRQIENLCESGITKAEAWRKQLSDELANVGKESSYVKSLKPVQENHPKFIDSTC